MTAWWWLMAWFALVAFVLLGVAAWVWRAPPPPLPPELIALADETTPDRVDAAWRDSLPDVANRTKDHRDPS